MSIGTKDAEDVPSTRINGLPFAVGFFFSFRLFIMLISVRLLGTDPETGVEAGLVLNVVFLVAVAFSCLGEVRFPLKQMVQLGPVRWAFVFLGFSGCSLLWSSAASLSAAVAFWCAMGADLAIVILLLRSGERRERSHSLMKGYIWGACAVAAIAWLMPVQSDLRLGDEDLLGPNAIGYLCGFALLWAQYFMRERDGKWRGAIVLLGITMLRSLSKTTIIAFLLCESFLLLRDKSMSRKTKQLSILSAALVVALFWRLLSSYYDVYTNAGNQAETLTGRLGIWAYILFEAVQQPWVGHGFHSVWHVIPPFGTDQFEARHAHNELLQQFYAYGAVGVCMLIGIYGSVWLHLRRLVTSSKKTFFKALLIFILVRGLADTEPFDLSLPIWCVVMISVLLADEERKTNEREGDVQGAVALQCL